MNQPSYQEREEMKDAWVLLAAQQVRIHEPGEARIFGTLTFRGSRPPGPQRGRKALEAFMAQDDILSGIVTEERGAENDRLHYHFVVVIEIYANEDSIGVIQDHWTHGYSLMDVMRDTGALAYVIKYATKTMSEASYFFVKERTDGNSLQMPLSLEVMFMDEREGGEQL